MKTKLSFRVYNKKEKRYLKGWKEATKHFLGFANCSKDETILHVSFDDGKPDTYYEIHEVDEG